MGGSRFVVGIAFIGAGYALAYYGLNVLVWAHRADAPKADPVPLAVLLGFPGADKTVTGQFMPPFQLGANLPNSVTDARGLLGGQASTGGFLAIPDPIFGGGASGGAGGATGSPSSDSMGTPDTSGADAGMPGGPAGGVDLSQPFAQGQQGAANSNPSTWQPPDIQVGNLGSALGQAITGPIGSGTPVPRGWKPGVGFG